MFRISRRLDYGLQIMIALAADPAEKPLSSAFLSEKLQIPLPFLHQIAHTLMQVGLIKASPGPRGGLRLNQPANQISIYTIAETLEGSVCITPCLDPHDTCPRDCGCAASGIWRDLQTKIIEHLKTTDLDTLVKQAKVLPLYSFSSDQENFKTTGLVD